MNLFFKCILYAIAKVAGPEKSKKLISSFASYSGLDLLLVAYNSIGILKYQNELVSGEYFLVSKVLKENLDKIERPVLFDIGANTGTYSVMLAKSFPHALIYAFEPNINTFHQLYNNVGKLANCINIGMSSEKKAEKIFTYKDNHTSSHASIYQEIFHDFYRTEDIVEIDIQLTTLDLFCDQEKITCIDFLKIDTEGNELNVLKGATKMLSKKKIKIIQFEFGECDVFSRVFLRDFYALLSEYNIYRLDSEGLIPLFEYNSKNEIFRFQNFIAVSKDFSFNLCNKAIHVIR